MIYAAEERSMIYAAHTAMTSAELHEEILYLGTLRPCRQRGLWLASARAALATLERERAEHAAAWVGLR